jgi:hypothetical protein
MDYLFSLLRIKGLYIFRALLAHPQEALHKEHLLYYVHLVQPTNITRTQHTKFRYATLLRMSK